MRTPTGSRWMSDNYITRCHRRLESVAVPVAVGVIWRQDVSVRISLQTGGLRPSVTHGWAALPECERSAAMVRRTLGQYVADCPHLQLTSHIQPTSTLSRIKNERYILWRSVFVRSLKFVIIVDYVRHIFVYVYVLCGYTAQRWDEEMMTSSLERKMLDTWSQEKKHFIIFDNNKVAHESLINFVALILLKK